MGFSGYHMTQGAQYESNPVTLPLLLLPLLLLPSIDREARTKVGSSLSSPTVHIHMGTHVRIRTDNFVQHSVD
jgi:hypothetical protein